VIEVYSDPASEEFSPLKINHIKNAVKRKSKFNRQGHNNFE